MSDNLLKPQPDQGTAGQLHVAGFTPSATPEPPHRHHVVKNTAGYEDIVFEGKKTQALHVEEIVGKSGFVPQNLVHNEVAWFYNNLGIDDQYFRMESAETVAAHVTSLYGAKILAWSRHQKQLDINLEKETETNAVYIHSSTPGVSDPSTNFEARIDEKFLDIPMKDGTFRLETYRSAGNVASNVAQQLRCYFVTKCNFTNPSPDPKSADYSDIRKVSDQTFLSKVSPNTLEIYQSLMQASLSRTGPVVECYEVEGNTLERRVVIAYRHASTNHFFSAMSDLYHFYGLYSTRKYVERFSNGMTIISIYLHSLRGPPIESAIIQVIREASLVFCLPNNPFFQPSTNHAVQEAAYAYSASIFSQHFLNRLGPSYLALKGLLNESDPMQAGVLNDIKRRFREETFTRQSITEVVLAYPSIIRLLYVNFALVHYINASSSRQQLMPTLSYQRLQTGTPLTDEELYANIRKSASNSHDLQVLESFLVFNKHILKTNFYTPTKVALSFRLDPAFLPDAEYPMTPYGLIMVVGSDFRGFHLRFKDVARGGIRIIRSRNKENYSINLRQQFDENYNLAFTQSLKNSTIPEGGAKGTILPELESNPRACFEKYVDGILDLLIPGKSPGIKDPIVDLYNRPEALFFGPDEGTADMMDWAALHARERGYDQWKSFTTGKSAGLLGGIPHDAFGMTSLSVRQFIVGIYRSLGLKETEVTKIQTGGPDGDLGSNEILLSKDKTITIIDGSGVIHDPAGLDRGELVRLAHDRKMVSNFDSSKFSKEGYFVSVDANDVVLPSGEIIPDGTAFRNEAHFRYKADIFVPCGGRPEAINVGNVTRMWDAEGKPNVKYIVEGANLFITQQARLVLEKKGVVLFKDASANKGGVTSSSLEVLVGLGLSDTEYLELMTSQNSPGFSEFYTNYVRDIQRTITMNAAAEFQCIWKESMNGQKPRAVTTDEIGKILMKLQTQLEESDLFDNLPGRRAVLKQAIPKTLIAKVGLETLMSRLPESYQRSLFSSFVAFKYIFQYGLSASAVDFFLESDLSTSCPQMQDMVDLEELGG
ncbi:glutamate dehydrogenase [Puccinia sorghi]|uniref:NAD-specific glutamate dehydrogenase n=1 Tax=Puccinia sorghi TaxID=27349 RepID=A0A0L6UE95_9BASI|nr:glutamate dehydrogenase [Puccinia sorghi]